MRSVIRKKLVFTRALTLIFGGFLSPAHAVFINEIHYDNRGADVGEGMELAGVAGQDLDGWSLLLYNGSNGTVYKSFALDGIFDDMQHGFGVLGFSISGLQNGRADGVALVDASDRVWQFLSYEGSMRARDGAAMGLDSVDIGVEEGAATSLGSSLQLIGSGGDSDTFVWATGSASFGEINARQRFTARVLPAITRPSISVVEPVSSGLFLVGLLLLHACRGQNRARRESPG